MEKELIYKKYCDIRDTANAGGYKLNPSKEFCMGLVEGILVNSGRYGIDACPCRLVRGSAEENQDIICPCYYRDDDLSEHGACFCALYIAEGFNEEKQIPDRRPNKESRAKQKEQQCSPPSATLKYPVWRCQACGYLCAKNAPPAKCPVCKAESERFERFL